MGVEVHGSLTVGGQKVNVKGDFASDHVTFSGGRRGEVPYAKVEVVSTAKGVLKLRVDGLVMEFPLGAKADRLANKIRQPPTLMEKLGVKADTRFASLGIPGSLNKQLAKTAGQPAQGSGIDLMFFGVRTVAQLDGLPQAKARIKDSGGIWVIYPKGRRDIRESDVRAAGRELGLVDVKVARISESHTALKFVVPTEERKEG